MFRNARTAVAKWLGDRCIQLAARLGGTFPNIIVDEGQVVRLEEGDFGDVFVRGGHLIQGKSGKIVTMNAMHISSGKVSGDDEIGRIRYREEELGRAYRFMADFFPGSSTERN